MLSADGYGNNPRDPSATCPPRSSTALHSTHIIHMAGGVARGGAGCTAAALGAGNSDSHIVQSINSE